MAAKRKTETSKKFTGFCLILLFVVIVGAIALVAFRALNAYQVDAIVALAQATTTFAGVAIGTYSAKAGVENVSKIKQTNSETEQG